MAASTTRPLDEPFLRAVYDRLDAAHGPQHWWPAQTPFEVMLGAILTQNTAWTNVERAIARLRASAPLEAGALLAMTEEALADAIRPAGYFNVKAGRLRAFCQEYLDAGGFDGLGALSTEALRHRLLAIRGVGPETADDMLLYAFARPVFVVDAYTRRLFGRLDALAADAPYEAIRRAFETALGPAVDLFGAYHALIVRHGKDACRARRPLCEACCLRDICAFSASPSDGPSPRRV